MGAGRGRRNCNDFCEKFARFIVIGINILFFCGGILVCVFASILINYAQDLQDNDDLKRVLLNDLNIMVVALIIAICGGIIIIFSICGIIGAWKQWRKCLVIYAAMMFMIVCIQIGMGAYLYQLSPDTINKKWHEAQPGTRASVQDFLDCCGWETVSDTTPYPVCVYPNWGPGLATNCRRAAEKYINDNIGPVAIGAIAIACAEFVAMFATCGLIYTAKDLQVGDDFFG